MPEQSFLSNEIPVLPVLWFDAAACWPWRFCHSWLLLLESPFQWTLTILALLSLGVLALRFYRDWCGAAHSVRPPGLFSLEDCAHIPLLITEFVDWRTLIRTDIGCSDSKVFDKDMKKLSKHGFSSCKLDLWEDTNWDPEKRTFFLNEIECRRKQNTHAKFSTESRMIGRYGGTTYFIRHLKEDFVPKTLGCNGKWEAKRWERS